MITPERIQQLIKEKPMIAYPVLGIGALIVWSLIMSAVSKDLPPQPAPKALKTQSLGVSVGGVDQQAYIAKLEKNYYDFEDRVKAVETELKHMHALAKELKKQDKETAKALAKMKDNASAAAIPISEISLKPATGLSIAEIHPVQEKSDDVSLPIGSFCRGTLLTGVYAAADVNNPLPVLITLDDAFYGPNSTRIPLKGAFVLGKAYGDLVSERAYVQIIAISSVLPDGHAFEREENLGYVTDQHGELGVRGRMVRKTGRELALSFMGGFVAGGAQAMADSEVTSTSNVYGTRTDQVSGSTAKNAVFTGLAKSAGHLSEYYAKQAENLVPAVHVRPGSRVYFVVQKGVKINGLPRVDDRGHDDMD